jgi:hypothetical protein
VPHDFDGADASLKSEASRLNGQPERSLDSALQDPGICRQDCATRLAGERGGVPQEAVALGVEAGRSGDSWTTRHPAFIVGRGTACGVAYGTRRAMYETAGSSGVMPCGRYVRSDLPASIHRTLRISCEAVPPSIWPAGAQGGTLSCRSGAALSFVSCIRLFGSPLPPRTFGPACPAPSTDGQSRR